VHVRVYLPIKLARVVYAALVQAARGVLGRMSEDVMSLVRLLGFTTLGCGCVVGR
jgi:hypothetical protein